MVAAKTKMEKKGQISQLWLCNWCEALYYQYIKSPQDGDILHKINAWSKALHDVP